MLSSTGVLDVLLQVTSYRCRGKRPTFFSVANGIYTRRYLTCLPGKIHSVLTTSPPGYIAPDTLLQLGRGHRRERQRMGDAARLNR